jgi:TRAP-type C4-dicarboxylate transport system substrate-binding protein
VFVSDKLWQSLSAEQKQWVLTAAAEISAKEPAKAFELEKTAAAKLKSIGVKIVEDVNKKSFTAIADPYLDKLAKELGPHAEKIKDLIRAVN